MSETLGKLERPFAADFQGGRKILFVPLIYFAKESPPEYIAKYGRYWPAVQEQIAGLEAKLGPVKRVYHELIPAGGETGLSALKELHEDSYRITKARTDLGAQFEAAEEADLLTEFLDWGRCLALGLENPRVFAKVYEFYTQAAKKRNEFIAGRINDTLKPDEIGLLFMREGHQVQFATDIQVFYISPPQLDDIKRYLRDLAAKKGEGE